MFKRKSIHRTDKGAIGTHAGKSITVHGVTFALEWLDCPGRVNDYMIGAYNDKRNLFYEFHGDNDYDFVVQFLNDEVERLC